MWTEEAAASPEPSPSEQTHSRFSGEDAEPEASTCIQKVVRGKAARNAVRSSDVGGRRNSIYPMVVNARRFL